jgi:hypothetical protein
MIKNLNWVLMPILIMLLSIGFVNAGDEVGKISLDVFSYNNNTSLCFYGAAFESDDYFRAGNAVINLEIEYDGGFITGDYNITNNNGMYNINLDMDYLKGKTNCVARVFHINSDGTKIVSNDLRL